MWIPNCTDEGPELHRTKLHPGGLSCVSTLQMKAAHALSIPGLPWLYKDECVTAQQEQEQARYNDAIKLEHGAQ